MFNEPVAYFISFHTYGTWLHGSDGGSVDRRHDVFGEPNVTPDRHRFEASQARMSGEPFMLGETHRWIVYHAIKDVCHHRDWQLRAIHVRTTHVHVVLTAATCAPERVMNDLKSWCTRRLREVDLIAADTHVWSRHGSTEYLWKENQVAGACDYVLHRQGAPLPMRPP